MSSTQIKILQFNDVYRVTKQKVSGGTIDVTQFAALLESRRVTKANGEPQPGDMKDSDTLVLFSGDLFSPSVESSVTRGSHMVPIMNALAPDCAVTGNHDFDFGYPHLSKLVKGSKYPWILSNIIDTETNKVPDVLKEFEVFERNGVIIGIIGLVEEEWIETVSSWPPNFQYKSMETVSIELSKRLRDPEGDYKCDIVIALTHSRVPNDIKLAKSLDARVNPDASKHGVDILFGGHDHFYFISKGVTSWDGYDVQTECLGAEEDDGILVIKSGTDFRDLSEVVLELEDAPQGSARRKIIKAINGKRFSVQPNDAASESMGKLLEGLLSSITSSLSKPVCKSNVVLDVRSELVRTKESAAGNWFADICRHAYDEALCMKGAGGADGVLICGGTLRGDSTYGPGDITIGDIMEVLPFQDPIVVQEMSGETIWAALEGALETWPAQEGRFPIVSGIRVTWDSSKPPGQRVLSVCQALATKKDGEDSDSDSDDEESGKVNGQLDGPPIARDKSKVYRIVTRHYMAEGHDGYDALKDCKFLISEEEGRLQSTVTRQYLLGAQYINKMKSLVSKGDSNFPFLDRRTNEIVTKEHQRHSKATEKHGSSKWKQIVQQKVLRAKYKRHAVDAFGVVDREHMSEVDCFDGATMRGGNKSDKEEVQELFKESSTSDLITINPVVDGRMRNVAQHE